MEDVEQLGFDPLFHDLLEGIHQLLRRVEEILRVIPVHKIAIEFCKCYWNTEFFVRYLLFLSLHAKPFFDTQFHLADPYSGSVSSLDV